MKKLEKKRKIFSNFFVFQNNITTILQKHEKKITIAETILTFIFLKVKLIQKIR